MEDPFEQVRGVDFASGYGSVLYFANGAEEFVPSYSLLQYEDWA